MNASKNSQIGGMSPICTPVYEFGQFRLESDNRLLLRGDQTVALTPKAFDTLLFLVERHGRLVSKDELISAVWAETAVCESNLTQTIFMLRKALGESASEQKHIVTVPGSGYRFVGVVETTSEEANGPVPDVVAERNVPVTPTGRSLRSRWPRESFFSGCCSGRWHPCQTQALSA